MFTYIAAQDIPTPDGVILKGTILELVHLNKKKQLLFVTKDSDRISFYSQDGDVEVCLTSELKSV